MRTWHAELWGKNGPYLEEGDTVLDQLAAFYASERGTEAAISNIAWMPDEGRSLRPDGRSRRDRARNRTWSLLSRRQRPVLPSPDVAQAALAEIADRADLVSMQSLLFGVSGAGLFDGAKATANLARMEQHRPRRTFRHPNPHSARLPAPRANGLPMNQALDQAAEVFRSFAAAAQAPGQRSRLTNPAAGYEFPQHTR